MSKIDVLKEILVTMNNTGPTLEEFFEQLEADCNSKPSFTKFKKS